MIASRAPGCKYRSAVLCSYFEGSAAMNGSIRTRNAIVIRIRHQKPADGIGVAQY